MRLPDDFFMIHYFHKKSFRNTSSFDLDQVISMSPWGRGKAVEPTPHMK